MPPIGEGHTQLSDDDRTGLIPTYIATRADLFDAEQRNLSEAALRPRPSVPELLDDMYLRDLHAAMFGQVWKWAGRYRQLETNIGIDPKQIPVTVRTLVDDARTWVDCKTYEHDELATRFHHRLVAIHPFPNGNGRHGRVVADHLVTGLGGAQFTWGAGLDAETRELRAAYLHALQNADGGDIEELLAFVRT